MEYFPSINTVIMLGGKMSQNEFTKANHRNGIDGQIILDSGLNVFGLQLMLESFTKAMGKDTQSIEFTYLGVDVKLQINEDSL